MPDPSAGHRVLLMLAGCTTLLILGYFGFHWARGAVWSYPIAAMASGSVLLSVLGCYTGEFGETRTQPVHLSGAHQLWVIRFHAAALATVEHYFPYAVIERPFLKLEGKFAHVKSRPGKRRRVSLLIPGDA